MSDTKYVLKNNPIQVGLWIAKINNETDVRLKQTSVYNLSEYITEHTANIEANEYAILV